MTASGIAPIVLTLLVGVLGLLGTVLALLVNVTRAQSRIQAELAHLQEWARSYRHQPWSTGDGVQRWIEQHKEQTARINERISQIEELLRKC